MTAKGYVKRFDAWNSVKKKLHSLWEKGRDKDSETVEGVKYFHRREVWWCSLGVNIGFEQDGKGDDFSRPVVILQTYGRNACLAVPLTTKNRNDRFYFEVGEIDGRQAQAILSQVRFIDAQRLVNKVGNVEKSVFKDLLDEIVKINLRE